MSYRLVTATTVLLTTLGTLQATTAPARVMQDQELTPALSFDSGLWQQMYRPEVPGTANRADAIQEHATDNKHPKRVEAGTTQKRLRHPGVEVDGTSLATVIIDGQNTGKNVDDNDGLLPEWEQSGASVARRGDPTTMHTVSGNGPTATTLLVALVAAIVTGGALFSGKD